MGRKALPMDDDEKKRFAKVRERIRGGSEISDEDKVFFATMKERCEAAGAKFKDVEAPVVETKTESPAPEAPLDAATHTKPEESKDAKPPEKPSKATRKKTPLAIPIPPGPLASMAVNVLRAMNEANVKDGYQGIPPFLFDVQQQALTDYLEELQAKGWDLRKMRAVVICGPALVVGAQTARRKLKNRKAEKKTEERTVSVSNGSNGVAEDTKEQPAARSTVKEGMI